MKKIALGGVCGRGRFAIVDDNHYDELIKYVWYMRISRGRIHCVYRTAWNQDVANGWNRGSIPMHIQILGKIKGMCIDHKDGNPLNNQKSNLRHCTIGQNSTNSAVRYNSTTGYRGVTHARGTLIAKITSSGKTIHLGTFKNAKSAAKAYNEAAKKYHGEFARLNKV